MCSSPIVKVGQSKNETGGEFTAPKPQEQILFVYERILDDPIPGHPTVCKTSSDFHEALGPWNVYEFRHRYADFRNGGRIPAERHRA